MSLTLHVCMNIMINRLPQYHDMGLIGSNIALMYCGGTGVYMSPATFIRNPPLWIETVSNFGGALMYYYYIYVSIHNIYL